MESKEYRFVGERTLRMKHTITNVHHAEGDKELYKKKTKENRKAIVRLQERLYAQAQEGLVVVLQAMDAAGKDSAIKKVFSGVNPQGVVVQSFKQPCTDELAHGYMRRAFAAMPARGKIAVFNRSYYEDVLVVKVHEMQKSYHMAPRCVNDPHFFEKRYKQISAFEQYLYDNSYRVVKIYLNMSKEEQGRRILERIDQPDKNWKFSASDLQERQYWDSYMSAYEDAINATATKHCPWYVIPADEKWYAQYLISEIVLHELQCINPQFPELPAQQRADLDACKEQLLQEKK
jgi:PPK2 family polyphosphate:nucleotide phosphotransferase